MAKIRIEMVDKYKKKMAYEKEINNSFAWKIFYNISKLEFRKDDRMFWEKNEEEVHMD